jgi:hypothetical protein
MLPAASPSGAIAPWATIFGILDSWEEGEGRTKQARDAAGVRALVGRNRLKDIVKQDDTPSSPPRHLAEAKNSGRLFFITAIQSPNVILSITIIKPFAKIAR